MSSAARCRIVHACSSGVVSPAGRSPLHVAAERGDVEACTSMCQCALRGGGDLDELTARLDRKRVSPLDLSAKAGGGSNAAVAQVLEKVLKGSGVRAV